MKSLRFFFLRFCFSSPKLIGNQISQAESYNSIGNNVYNIVSLSYRIVHEYIIIYNMFACMLCLVDKINGFSSLSDSLSLSLWLSSVV